MARGGGTGDKASDGMRLLLIWLLRLLVVVIVLAVFGSGLAWYLITRSLPDFDGEIRVGGLDAPVRIIRDANAIPHIKATSDHDAWFALGLVHAQDRLWQMELSRRAAQGRMSALLGARTVEVDRLVKTLDLYGLASRSVAAQSPETIAALESYADGVNAWIKHVNTEALGRGAPEFFLFGGELSPWTPADSLGILKIMALRLSVAASHEVRRAQALLALPPDRIADILPDYPVPARISMPRSTARGANGLSDHALLPDALRGLTPRAADTDDPLLAQFGLQTDPALGGASNAWAVDGTRTSGGKPLMANDPHLWLSAPSVWHVASIEAPGMAAIGGALPGVPGILVGRNRTIGWGLTTTNVDDQDLYVEEVNPDNPDEYLLPDGTWAKFDTRSIRIEIDGQVTRTDVVRSTRHGPVLTGKQFGADRITPDGFVTSLKWTALTEQDTGMTAVLGVMRADDIETAMQAAEGVVAPAQNLMLASADGIGMIVAGAVPDRSPLSLSQGRVPSAGAHGANDWLGVRPASSNPKVLRPSSGAVANANNRVTDQPYPAHLSFNWARPYRIQRLEKELAVRSFHSRDGFVALQSDAVSEMARSVLPLIAQDLWWREGTPAIGDEIRREALELLAGWNGEMDQHGPEPLIFKEWMRALTRRLAQDELGALFEDMAGVRPIFVERVFRNIDGAEIWCDVNKTPEVETCQQAASIALDDALARLVRDYGSDVNGWRWGAEHVAVHRHTPLGFLAPLGSLFNIEHETPGGDFTLLRGQTRGVGDKPFKNVHAAGLRVVYDFADLDRSLMIISTGISGHPFSRWYDHLAEPWARGDMIPMSISEEDASAGAVGTLVLMPEKSGN
ncbi:MAG: penicillin acylase family protein [Pseudomonadota bacterium]